MTYDMQAALRVATGYENACGIHPDKGVEFLASALSAAHAAGKAEGGADQHWRCFHCDEVFTTREAAQEHFGPDELCTPACKINIAEYRRMEDVHQRHLTETDEASVQLHAMRADHLTALRREEEKGYARGIADLPAERATARAEALEEAARVADSEAATWRAAQSRADHLPSLQKAYEGMAASAARIATTIRALISAPLPPREAKDHG